MSTSKERMKRFFFLCLYSIFRLQFLPDVFNEENVYIRSTDYPRTQESVQQLIAGGLYPKGKRPEDFVLKLRIR